MNETTYKERYFVDSIVFKNEVSPKNATHFAIYNGERVRFYISLDKNFRKVASMRLSKSVSAYSRRLRLLIKILRFIPFTALYYSRIGKFVNLDLEPNIHRIILRVGNEIFEGEGFAWNVLIGSYVEKQKVVFHCFSLDREKTSVFIKVGGEKVVNEMLSEIKYLENPIKSTFFQNPSLYFVQKQTKNNRFIFIATKEFLGSKVETKISNDILSIFHEIANSESYIDKNGVRISFSHGDFTPWNLKRVNNKYVVFDWEYSGMRFYGFDLIHFFWQIENKLHKRSEKKAIELAISQAQLNDEMLRKMSKKSLEEMYFDELKRSFGRVL